jgi:hypothetical protein
MISRAAITITKTMKRIDEKSPKRGATNIKNIISRKMIVEKGIFRRSILEHLGKNV